MGFLDYTSAKYHYYLGSQSNKMLRPRIQNNPLAHDYAHTNSRSSNMSRDDDDDEDHDSNTNKSAMLNGNRCGGVVSGGNSSLPISRQAHAFEQPNTTSSCMISLNPVKQNGHMANIKCKFSESDKIKPNNDHSRNSKKNFRQNRDYLTTDKIDAVETMPDEEELDHLFAKVLATMDLPPDKSKVLWGYDRDKKWELIRDQRRVQAKQEPRYYLAKLRSHRNNPMSNLRQQVTSRFQVPKLKSRKADAENGLMKNGCSTQILRDLEISLRTNSIEWVREFLSEKNNGLDAIVDYLIFRLSMLHSENLSLQIPNDSKQHTSLTSSVQPQATIFMNHSPNNSLGNLIFNQKTSDGPKSNTDVSNGSQERKHLSSTNNITAIEDIHVCIMCLRSIMNNKKGFNMVMEHQQAINCLALSLNFTSIRTKTLILELLAAVCLVKGGHELIISAFDNFKTSCREQRRFETLVYHFRNQEKFDVDFMVSCLQFINIIVHSQDDMNYRTHLQYEFTNLGLDEYLEKLKQNESDELHLQIQTYLDNRIDVSSLAEEAEVKNSALEQVQQLIEKLSISNELQTQLQLNYQVLDGKLQGEMKKNEELLKSNDEYKAQVIQLLNQMEQRDGSNQRPISANHPTSSNLTSDYAGSVDPPALIHAMKYQANNALVPIRSAQDTNASDRSTTTKILVNSQNGGNPVKKAPAPAPPPPPPPPPLQHSTILQSSSQLESAPPPPPPPPPMMLASSMNVSHKKGLAPQPPMVQISHGDQEIKSPRQVQGGENSNVNINCDMMTLKKTFSTQYKLPTFNWSTLKPNQVRGTIFNEFHDEEKIIKSIDFKDFEEQFKLGHRTNKAKAQARSNANSNQANVEGPQEPDLNTSSNHLNDDGANPPKGSNPGAQAKRFKQPEKVSFMEHNRLRNMAISLRKLATPTSLLVSAINRLDIEQLPLDSLEILMRMIPTPQEVKAYHEYEVVQGKSVDALTDEDKFLCNMSKIDRLECKVRTMFYMKNLDTNVGNHSGNSLSSAHSISSSNTDSADLLSSTKVKIESIETASKSLRNSDGIRTLLEYILVFGNYLNSSSRSLASAPAYGFKLQALDMVTEARSTQDKSRNLLHFIVDTIMKNLSPRERASMSSIGTPSRNSEDSELLLQEQMPSQLRPIAGMKRSSPLAPIDQETTRMPYQFETLMSELEQAANVSLETLLIETNELEKGMDLCVKELKLRCAAAEALEQQRQHQQHSQPHASPSPDRSSPDSIKSPTDESISRLQRFIKTRSHEIVELRELIRRAQREFNECAQYFGENPRTIESSSLFSIFLRHLKNFRQCLVDNKLIEKRKFDEELRKQIQEQQAVRAQKKRLATQGCQSPNSSSNNNNNNLVGPARGQSQSLSNKDQCAFAGETRGQFDSEGGRLLHQDEVSHGTLDILITGLKVEPYRRVEGLRKSLRRLERQSFGAN